MRHGGDFEQGRQRTREDRYAADRAILLGDARATRPGSLTAARSHHDRYDSLGGAHDLSSIRQEKGQFSELPMPAPFGKFTGFSRNPLLPNAVLTIAEAAFEE